MCLVDTTQADAAAKALSDQQEQLMAILDNSADAIRLVDARGRLIFANKALFVVLGLPHRRRKAARALPRLPDAIAQSWREDDRKALKGGRGVSRGDRQRRFRHRCAGARLKRCLASR